MDESKQYNVSFYLLIALLLVLPNFEAPKNIILVLFILAFLYEQKQNNKKETRWAWVDYIFFVWIVLDIIVGLNAIIFHDMPANGSKDLLKFLIFGWIISRSFYVDKQVALLLLAVLLSVLVPSILLIFSCPNGGACIELNSAGHVNHTAIFLVSVYAILLPFLYLKFSRIKPIYRVLCIITLIVLAYVITMSMSRASFGLLVIINMLTLAHYVFLRRKFTQVLTVLILGFVIGYFL